MELMLVGQLFMWLVTWVVLQVYFENRQRRNGDNQQRAGGEIMPDIEDFEHELNFGL